MRRSLIVFTFAAVLAAPPAAQAGIWTPVSTGTTENISAVEYQASNRLWFTSESGGVFRRMPDGSFAPSTMFSGGSSGVLFRDIAASPDGSTVIAVGDASGSSTPNVWRSVDGGASFARVTLPVINRDLCGSNSTSGAFGNAFSVQFADANTVYVPGQYMAILKSTNGGASFVESNRDPSGNCKVSGSDGLPADSQWTDANNGWFIGRYFGSISRTNDGLTSNTLFLDQVINEFDGLPRLAIDKSNPARQWAVDRTTDGFSATDDGWNTVLDNFNGGLTLRGGGRFREPRDVVYGGGTVLMVGAAGQIFNSINGRAFVYQPADGGLNTRDWRAVDTFDGRNAAVGGVGGSLVLTTRANYIPPPPPPPPGDDTRRPPARDTTPPQFDSGRFGAVAGGGVSVLIGCGRAEEQGCRVALRMASRRRIKLRRRARARRLVLGRKTQTLRAGQRLRVKVPLNRTGKRALRRYKRLPARVDLTVADLAGNQVKTTQNVTLKAKKKKRRRR